MAKLDPEREAHKSWLGLVQPVGLVVSPPALVKAGVCLDKNVAGVQQAFQSVVVRPASVHGDADPLLLDFPRFAAEVLGWAPGDLAGGPGGPPLPDALAVALPDYGETLRPSYAAVDGMAGGQVVLLVQVVERGLSLDRPPPEDARKGGMGWPASPQARLERLLRDTGVPAGLLLNGDELRLVYAPRGESSGHMGFPVAEMCAVRGRPLLGAVHMLLSEHRVFSAPDRQRLLDLLVESRKYQNEVSNRLAEQVLGALWELLRGFQGADEAANGHVLYDLPRADPQQIYGGLLTVIMRLVFLLYAEDQGLMPDDPVYARNYAIGGLFERLREDAGRHPDTMDQRFGAYAWLLSTFRMVFDGGAHGGLHLPTRHGQLFNPDEYGFLEGRPPGVHRVVGETFEAPRVSDGVIWRVLEGLLVLDGERLSYRALDVEQVGSVYESMMGFDVRTLPGRAIAVRPKNVVFDVDALLAVAGGKRAAWLKEEAECDLAAGGAQALKEARTVEDVVVALGRKVAPQTPRALAPGALFLQPGEERRRSGSHYTPRELTEPIVRTTLRPVLEALGPKATPEQILELKVCDPAMGSGAFLVEACRQLAAALVAAWEAHGVTPKVPADEEPLLHARRLVAQGCLYGVDKNRFAVNLAKLSLWLVTLAKEHAFTFLDHALKHGDSLVGLTKSQLGAFHWSPPENDYGPLFKGISADVIAVTGWRAQIQALGEASYNRQVEAWEGAEEVVKDVRLIGDLCIAAYFGKEKDKEREALRRDYRAKVDAWKKGGDRAEIEEIVGALRGGERPVLPFHWEIEFPEVFGRGNPGFDAIIGNPPYMGGTRISSQLGHKYLYFLVDRTSQATGNVDLAAFFLRRGDFLARVGGAFGFVTTNSITAGDSGRASTSFLKINGRWPLCDFVERRWPGESATVAYVSLAYQKRPESLAQNNTPRQLARNADKSARGWDVFGVGFLLSNEEARKWMAEDAALTAVISPYIGGAEFNVSPTLAPERHIINFGEMIESEARVYSRAFAQVAELVKPARMTVQQRDRRELWWLHATRAPRVRAYMERHGRVLVASQVSKHLAFGFVANGVVISHTLNVFLYHSYAAFCALQSRPHEVWARKYGSSLEDRPRYTPLTCFQTYPQIPLLEAEQVERAGCSYYEFRAQLMAMSNGGLTTIYNRFHDPHERDPEILHLRELHAAMDRAVLDAYGWTDIPTDCDFLLDYEIDEEAWGTKKKPYRYRWPDEVRDEVLARLLDLNQKRHKEELAAGLHGKAGTPAPGAAAKARSPRKPSKPRTKSTPPAAKATLALFDTDDDDP